MKDGFIKVAAVTPKVKVADVDYNCQEICQWIDKAMAEGVKVMVFPELCITGYTCQDLFLQDRLLEEALEGLQTISARTKDVDALIFVGLPLAIKGKLYNVAAAINNGRVVGIVPKTFLPNYNEFYEERWFSSASDAEESLTHIRFAGEEAVPFGTDVLLRSARGHAVIAAEICEDAWVPLAPSMRHCMAGANVVVNLSASNDLVAKTDYRRDMLRMLSARGICA